MQPLKIQPSKKLTWQEIEVQYDREWVELIDYDWPDEEANPKAGIVRVHAKTRKEFDELLLIDTPLNSACLYVGETLPDNVVFISASLHHIK